MATIGTVIVAAVTNRPDRFNQPSLAESGQLEEPPRRVTPPRVPLRSTRATNFALFSDSNTCGYFGIGRQCSQLCVRGLGVSCGQVEEYRDTGGTLSDALVEFSFDGVGARVNRKVVVNAIRMLQISNDRK